MNIVLTQGAIILSGLLLKKAFDYGYKKVAKEDPPEKIRNSTHSIAYIIGWTLLTGAMAGVARLITRDLIHIDLQPDYIEA